MLETILSRPFSYIAVPFGIATLITILTCSYFKVRTIRQIEQMLVFGVLLVYSGCHLLSEKNREFNTYKRNQEAKLQEAQQTISDYRYQIWTLDEEKTNAEDCLQECRQTTQALDVIATNNFQDF